MSTQAQKIVGIARAEKGYQEGRKSGHWNNDQKYSNETPGLEWSDFQAWCATFVSWCALKAGLAALYPRTASCLTGVSWFKQRKQFSAYPAVGAQVFFGKNGGTHTGLVYDYDDTYVYTIEGNTNASGSPEGDGVYEKKHRRTDAYVYGYGYPAFAEGIKSADPAWKDKAPKPQPPAPQPVSQIVALNPAVKPGAEHAQVRDLQQLLIKAGYGPIKGAVTSLYGPETQRAVARFHDRNPAYRSGLYDPRIGPKGFVALQKQAGRR
ncbi:CHAP domain-containing protein [Streptomyces antarcticus]|uniref:CHAP domain-containing protein n=1 Tax=Streptomyces antarcticus TaxID=2996458 RepID=UPI00226E6971|nr:CHAP domain-containing protein [Streptomyces sp. H34-AA3]MCY0946836.1 CHAP domain-containing protein [Streptomyces sp. H34-AA3]